MFRSEAAKGSVKSLYLPIASRMVSCCSGFDDFHYSAQLLNQAKTQTAVLDQSVVVQGILYHRSILQTRILASVEAS